MSFLTGAFDILIAVSIVWLALSALTSKDIFRAVVLFIIFSVMTSIAWIRLNAPDIALAEAAIGAGVTGVLFLDALGYMKRKSRGNENGKKINTEEGA